VDELEATELNGDSEHATPVSLKHDDGHVDGSPMVSHTVSPMPSAVPEEGGVGRDYDVDDGRLRLLSPSEVRLEEGPVQLVAPSKCDAPKLGVPRRKCIGSCPPRAGRS
jgi:hypothetical protein